ncbi:sarcosine oxidase subunit alpha [Breoghania corrubedonensis]|uniref:Sarcosine oxidase subunit alpha n=1 Tax=Breoghania corrubedonensis TaxID=665038 RepID=A0A2T5V7U4_9HYPH|nr:sarcosine oxidase subunit alpha [Breoghania corrubedonensis]PTW59832.1 sarcosine oxidase subunit alpha [Breoghania corrubedonensis]
MAEFRNSSGGRIDRARPLTFRFNGKRYQGFSGDTLASALLANGVHLVGRSFKYHRPRGIVTAGAEEPNALVQLETGGYFEPNLRATQVELYDGLTASSQNAWPSVDFDIGAINGFFSKLFVAGFYYKTFMHPRSFWMRVYEPIIRRAAAGARAPSEADPDTYDKMHAHCDVLVAGAGPAGLMAALEAAKAGARVIVADEQAEFGGSLLGETSGIDGIPAAQWVEKMRADLAAFPEVRLLPRTTVTGYYDHNYLIMAERKTDHLGRGMGGVRQRLWKVRAKRVVLATGAHERPLVFADNDRPGIMLAGAARAYVNRYGVKPGNTGVVFTNNDSAYEAAIDLAKTGCRIEAIIDVRPQATGAMAQKARAAGLRIICGAAIAGVEGAKRVKAVEIAPLSSDGETVGGPVKRIECDFVAVSGGWTPAVHLLSQSGGKLRFDEAKACFVPNVSVQAETSAGACNGTLFLEGALEEGAKAGRAAVEAVGLMPAQESALPKVETVEAAPIHALWIVPGKKPVGHGKAKHFVDAQNDVTAADIMLASREGYRSVEHLKRYTTTGMGTDQGKTSNVNALAILSRTLSSPIPSVGTTTFRPPYTPVTYGTLAGRDVGELSDVARVTPMHGWHVARGAVFEDVGQWKRPWYYPKDGESLREAVNRECLAVRNGVGILDASTLGKIDIQGPDAAEFLNRVYTNAWSKLGIGRCRYGIMCKEDGMVFDDGVTTRLGENHFLMTTTTGNAAAVLDRLEDYLQTEWPDLKVYLTSVTEHWATASIAGPKARELVGELAPDLDLSNDAFPFMSMKEATVAGLAARIYRISFTGELSYEINVPAYQGMALWEAIFAAGETHGLTPYGTETMHVLRAEKGFIIVGQETDGTVTPFDLGMDWIVSTKKPDFVGKRSFSRPDTARTDRKQLVGLLTEDPEEVLPEGAQITADADGTPPMPMLGHVTSSYWSATLGRSIAMALIADGGNRQDTTVHAPLGVKTLACKVVKPVFFDSEGARLNG